MARIWKSKVTSREKIRTQTGVSTVDLSDLLVLVDGTEQYNGTVSIRKI
jgi:hypothetical protein